MSGHSRKCTAVNDFSTIPIRHHRLGLYYLPRHPHPPLSADHSGNHLSAFLRMEADIVIMHFGIGHFCHPK